MFCLDGLKVIDMCNRLNGSYVAMFLGDFGADVIRVDPPWPGTSFVYGVPEDRLAAYWCTDRNKRSMVLNLKDDSAREVFMQLVKKADVLIEGNRPGAMDKLGVGYSVLAEQNPRLIYAALSGFGQDGPYKMMPAHDMNYVALSGAMSLIGEKDGQPYMPSNLVADIGGAGMHALVGILLALISRERTGRGQFVDISYLDSVISLLAFDISGYFASGVVPHRGETQSTGSEVWGQVWRCKDGQYFCTGATEPKFWANLCSAIGRDDLVAARTPHTDRDLSEEQKAKIKKELADIFVTKTRDEWFEIVKNLDTCATPVYNIDEAVKDPHVLARDMVVELDHPIFGKVKQPGLAIKLSDTPGSIRNLGVPKGTNTEEIIAELGYNEAEIAAMKERGALG